MQIENITSRNKILNIKILGKIKGEVVEQK